MKKLVIFDIDKTIYDGNLYEDIIFHLLSKNLISDNILPTASKEFLELKLNLESYEEFILDLLKKLKESIDPKNTAEILRETKFIIQTNKGKFRDFAFEIPKLFPQFEYLIISLEPHFVVGEVASLLKIPNYLSNHVDISSKHQPKYQVDKFEMLKNSKFSEYDVFATFGDSELDYTLLLEASHKFVFNPTSSLKDLIEGDPDFKITDPAHTTNIFKSIAEK